MKYLNLKLTKNENTLIYPDGYQANFGNKKVAQFYYGINRESYLLLVMEDLDVPQILPRGMSLITESEAITIINNNDPVREVITDEAKVKRLQIKALLGQTFTQEELDAIDPNSATLGIEYKKRISDMIPEFKRLELLRK